MNKDISFENYNEFLKIIEYYSPRDIEPVRFNIELDKSLFHLKDEIRNNIILFDKENRISYLKKLLHDLKIPLKSVASISINDINKWLKKYNTTYEAATSYSDVENELHFFLQSFPVTYSETEKNNYNPLKEDIQIDFCKYFYKHTLEEAIDFINDQFEITEPTAPKLKTNLSVPELATLFRELNKLKPDIFDIKSKAELHRFIANNVTSKQQDNISTASIKNNFDTPDSKAADFWIEKMYTIIDNLKKSKEK